MTDLAPVSSPASEVVAFVDMIERVARDSSIDIDRLDRLLVMRERENARRAEQAFNEALSLAQTEMQPVGVDSDNPQTRSRFASYAALDRAVRPIYTKYGFGLSFNTADEAPGPEQVRIICAVSHGGYTRRYHIDMPVDGKGARGGDVMTKTHAMGSGISYGMRYLLRMIFNLAIDQDDDGNAAGGRAAALPARIQRNLDRLKPKPDGVADRAMEDNGHRGFTDRRYIQTLRNGGIADRAMVARAHREWERPAGPSKAFLATEAGKPALREGFDERNPPPHEDIPDHAAGKALNRELHPMNDRLPGDLAPDREPHRAMLRDVMKPLPDPDIPEFLQRKLQSDEPTYVDLVEGEMIPAVPASKS
jgi:ERF superfamily